MQIIEINIIMNENKSRNNMTDDITKKAGTRITNGMTIIILILLISVILGSILLIDYAIKKEEQKMDEVGAAHSVDFEAVSIGLRDADNGKTKATPPGTTFTVSTQKGNITYINGNRDYSIIEYPNGTVVTRDFNRIVNGTSKYGYELDRGEYEYMVKYKNGSTLHFYYASEHN